MIVTASLTDSAPSLAVSWRTYVPSSEKVAVVAGAAASPNVTVPGPLTFVHCVVSGEGIPSSLAVPASVAVAVGNVSAWSGPAFTTGAWFDTPVAVTVMASLAESSPSVPVKVST